MVPRGNMGLRIREKNVLSTYICVLMHSSYSSRVILAPFFLFRGHYIVTILKAVGIFFLYRYEMNSGNIIFCTIKTNSFSLAFPLMSAF